MRLLHDPDSAGSYLFEVDFFGKRYRGDLARYMDWAIFCYGSSSGGELGTLRAASQWLRPRRPAPIVFFDIGANVGEHSIFMADVADRIVAFEPFAGVRELFEKHVALNGLKNVEIIPFGLGEMDKVLTFFPGPGNEATVGTFVESNRRQQNVTLELPVRNGDRFCDEKHYPRIDLMKVDVEGFESSVFRGLRKRIRRDRPIILSEMLEFTRAGFSSEAEFRGCFYEDAVFANVKVRQGSLSFGLRPFRFETNGEVLIAPQEMVDCLAEYMSRN